MGQIKSLLLVLLFSQPLWAVTVFHQLNVELEPEKSQLKVVDEMTLTPELCAKKQIVFHLHGDLKPQTNTPGVKLKKLQSVSGNVPREVYQLSFPENNCTINLSYGGTINHPPTSELSAGTIDERGVFLGGSTYWYPMIEDQLVSFELKTVIASPWSVVSQGELMSSINLNGKTAFTWKESLPQDDIYIIAGDFKYYSKKGPNNDLTAEAYLRSDDPQLAEKYLNATLGYLQLYGELIGPYPYTKFALIENFWETGYGMPSFTLLGPTIIKLPFILYTSYPHEVLHNWWGNGVYVNYDHGNWSEGLTSYMADHYFKEQRGKGHEYRRDALNNYASYVNEDNDFPLSEFLSRYDKASSAIGYGKVMMFFHMLRKQLGDESFYKGISQFYSDNLFKRSSYENIKDSFEGVSGENLDIFFEQWVKRTGAPKLKVTLLSYEPRPDQNKWIVEYKLEQTQSGQVYDLYIPYKIIFDSGKTVSRTLMNQKTKIIRQEFGNVPKSIILDPDFDVFRHIYKEEIPASLAQVYGESKKLTVVLPSKSDQLDKYKAFANNLKNQFPMAINIVSDDQLNKLPEQGSLWILGWSSLFTKNLECLFTSAGAQFTKDGVAVDGSIYLKDDQATVIALRQLKSSASTCVGGGDRSLIWTGLNKGTDPAVLAGKIFHYGSYSFIGFDSSLSNSLKGQWSTTASPLQIEL